jgi:hypothetical protein
MAYIANVKILVDEVDENTVSEKLNALLQAAKTGSLNGDEGWIVDWQIGEIAPVDESLEDSIVNGTYEEGEAFEDWVIFSPSECKNENAGYWSNEWGWTTFDEATHFNGIDPTTFPVIPVSSGNDAMLIMAKHRLEFYRLMLIEQPDDAAQNQTPIAFECFAENYDHAVDQAENAYPGCKVLGMDI